MTVYTVTTIAPHGPAYGGTRLVAICESIEKARGMVERNEFDMYETTYTYVVIEPVETDCMYGSLEFDEAMQWYKWEGDWKTGKYTPIPTPERFLRQLGFWESGPIRNSVLELKTLFQHPESDRRFAAALAIVDAEHAKAEQEGVA